MGCKQVLHRLALVTFFFLSLNASATIIVDTGTPTGGPNWSFYSGQWFAGEFSITDAYTLDTVESYFRTSTAGNVTISIHSDGGNIPGGILYSANLAMAANSSLDWYGLNGLNWSLGAGTYWASFTPDGTINGTMPGTAPNPLDEYAQNQGAGWQDNGADFYDYLDIGFRITATNVPEPATLALLGMGLFGLGFSKRKPR